MSLGAVALWLVLVVLSQSLGVWQLISLFLTKPGTKKSHPEPDGHLRTHLPPKPSAIQSRVPGGTPMLTSGVAQNSKSFSMPGTTGSRSGALHLHSCRHGKRPQSPTQHHPLEPTLAAIGCFGVPWCTTTSTESDQTFGIFWVNANAKEHCQCPANPSVSCTSSRSCWNHCTGRWKRTWNECRHQMR